MFQAAQNGLKNENLKTENGKILETGSGNGVLGLNVRPPLSQELARAPAALADPKP